MTDKLNELSRASRAIVASGLPDLTMRQTAILMAVVGPDPLADCRTRKLAAALQLSKPVVTRAVTALEALGLLGRHRGEADARDCFMVPGRGAPAYLAALDRALAA